jgi:hypothetical protein
MIIDLHRRRRNKGEQFGGEEEEEIFGQLYTHAAVVNCLAGWMEKGARTKMMIIKRP